MTTLYVPIRDFGGMTRLANTLSEPERRRLTRDLALKVVVAGLEADLQVVTVTGDHEVATCMREVDVPIKNDPGTGLSNAAAAATTSTPYDPWIVAHADLPLISADALRLVAQQLDEHTVLVPSLDGGTNVIASRGVFPFSYGPGSFHRHLASSPDAVVLTDPRLAIDLDLPVHLRAMGVFIAATLKR